MTVMMIFEDCCYPLIHYYILQAGTIEMVHHNGQPVTGIKTTDPSDPIVKYKRQVTIKTK